MCLNRSGVRSSHVTLGDHLIREQNRCSSLCNRSVDIVCAARGALQNVSALASGPDIWTKLHYRING